MGSKYREIEERKREKEAEAIREMDRNREARRVPMAAAGNGLSRRRHRAGSFRDSPEEDVPVELPEAARLRDRGGSSKKERDRERDRDRERERERDNRERDRLHNRSKRRRGERLVMVHGDDGGDDSSEESVNDDEEYDDGGGGPPSSLKMLPPSSNISAASFSSSLSNHHHHHHHSHNHQRKNFPPTSKVFRSPPSPAPVTPVVSSWKAADEMIGVAVPRKARSACTKRPHESWASSASGGGVFASGEQIHRQVSPASNLASPSPPAPTSPSSSNVSARKKMPSGTKQKPLPPKPAPCKLSSSSSPVAVQDEIEIEIAEVLYGMMRMPLAASKQESAGEEGAKTAVDVKSRVSSPISNSQALLQSSTTTLAANSSSSNVSAIVPKRKKPRIIKYDDENSSNLPSRAVKSEAEAPTKSQVPLGDQLKRSGSAEESSAVLDSTNPQPRESNASLDSRSAEKKENNPPKEETVSPKVETSPGFRSDGDGAKISSPAKEKKFEIDLMAPPPVRSTSERGGEMECVAAEANPKVTEVVTEAKPLLKEDGGNATIESEEKKRSRAVAEAEPHKSERSCELKLDLKKSDNVGVVNKHHVQKQAPPQQQQQQQQQQPSIPDKTAQATPMPLHMSMPGWPGGLPTMGYMPPTQGVVPADTTSSLSSAAMQPPPHLLFNQPRPKRCATHCYIARNIQSHQQFIKMNPFWPAAAGSAPLYGTKACNLSLMPPTELQGTVLGRSSNPGPDVNSQSTSKGSDTGQRNQILLQQALPPGAANNMMHGPTFIIPVGQQPHAAAASVRPNSGNTGSSGATATANSMNGSASATPAGAPTMTFSYPGMPGNETQYLAILQNNGYPFQVPAHVGAPPAYRGAPGQPMPFFNGSFYSSQMIQPPFSQPQKQQQQPQQQQAGQIPQSHSPSNQNGSVSTSSSAAQKHLQNQQLRPPINHGNSQGFPTHKVQSQPLSFQQRHQHRENTPQHSETVGEDSPSTADSRSSRSSVAYGQNYGMQMQPTNLGLMSSAVPGGGVVVSSSKHCEKKSQQQGSKAGMESFQSQGYAMTFATFNGTSSAPSLNMSSIPQNHPMFHSMPEAARQGYQMMAANVAAAQAAQQKMNYSAPSDDGKSGSNATANTMEEQRKTGKTSGVNGGQSIAFSNKHDLADASVSAVPSGSIVDTSRLLNLGSAMPQSSSSMPTSHQQQLMQQQQQQLMQQQQQQHMQRNQSQQPYPTMYLQKQQRYATSVAASAARTKGSVANNGSGFPDHSITISPAGGAKFPNANSGFPQNLVQSPSNQVQSTQWKNNSPRTTSTAQAQSPSILSPSSSAAAAASSLRNVSHKQQSRPQQSQISFAANSKPMASGSPMQQMQGGANNRAPSPPMLVGSPSTSSVSKNAGGSPRTTASASSAVNKAGQASSTTHSSSQPSKNLQSASVASSTGGRNNGPSVLGNPTTSSGSKSQQQQLSKHGLQQQAQLFFSNPYMQSQHQQQQQIAISPSGGYFIQRHQQQPGSAAAAGATSVTLSGYPAKAIAAAAAAANNVKGGGGMGKTQQHQLGPPGFTYVHAVPSAVQVKPADQKQQAGE
ncbi:BnaA05g17250D [Brassica napus]|uniref:BnaA05g17250D protein n=1 Tax=Brassica napus TaxID=3708 RepID=A0A078FCB9_BRANA|nr:BnaA05g17250D [Brassica napus]